MEAGDEYAGVDKGNKVLFFQLEMFAAAEAEDPCSGSVDLFEND